MPLIRPNIPGHELPDVSHELTGNTREFDGQLCRITIGNTAAHAVVKKQSKDSSSDKYLDREMSVLKRLRKHSPKVFSKYLPEPVGDTYVESGHRTNMFVQAEGYYTLDEVLTQYPDGIPAEDLAWIGNRLFEVVAFAHDLGIIHGCINTSNFLINPETHGGMLIDWCYSVNAGKPIQLVVTGNMRDYPPEVAAKHGATRRTDTYMIGKTLIKLVDDYCPLSMVGFFKSLTIDAYGYRPTDTYNLMTKYKTIQYELFGAPHFHEFTMTTTH
jgi:serine/threonine protein kinase